MPMKRGRISISGNNITPWRIRASQKPMCALPNAVKKVEVVGCREFIKVINKNMRIYLLPNS